MKNYKTYLLYSFAISALVVLGLSSAMAQNDDEGVNGNQMLSQETLYLKLEDVLQLAGAKSLVIKEYKSRVALAKAEHSKAKEWWLPILYGGIQTHSLTGAAMNADGDIFTDVVQKSTWAGLGATAEWDFARALFLTKSTKKKIEAQKLISSAEKNKAVLLAINTFYDMQGAHVRALAINDLMVNKAEDVAKQIAVQVDLGILFKSELLLAQTKLIHLKIQQLQAEMKYRTKAAEMANLLNANANVRVECAESGILDIQLAIGGENSTELSVARKRPGYKALMVELESLKIEKRSVTAGIWLPKVRLNTYGSLFGENFATSYPTNMMNLGVMWRIPLGSFIMRGEAKKYNALIDLQETKLRQFENSGVKDAIDARSMVDLSKEQARIADQALQYAAQAMMQSIQRQAMGTAKPFEVFQAQEFYLQTKMDYILAVTNLNKSQYALFVALGYNF